MVNKKKKKENKLEKNNINPKVKHKTKKIKSQEEDIQVEWYYYFIVFLIIFSIIFGGYYLLSLILEGKEIKNDNISFYNYKYKVGNVTYNIEFRYPIKELEKNLSEIPSVRLKFLNSIKVVFSFDEYNKSDNGRVTVASLQLMQIIKEVFKTNVVANSTSVLDCPNATLKNKIVTFNPYSEKNVVYWENPYCLRINATNSSNLIYMTNRVMFKAITE